jgi:glycolate oxidase FAD binding subunit
VDTPQTPRSPQELAEALHSAASAGRAIQLEGSGSKRLMAGPVDPRADRISTTALTRVLDYEPADLTISVEAGLPWCELTRLLAVNRQMIPLDPPFSTATVGGVLASNTSGPRRRLYGSGRDMVIGMRFATVEGKLVDSGGKVVKNVAGLDMAKLMIGSFGTLAAIATVNFKLQPMPETERSFLLPFASAAEAIAARNSLLVSPLQPAAIDLLNPAAGAVIGNSAWLMTIRAGGNRAAVDRYERELAPIEGSVAYEDELHQALWRQIGEFTPEFLAAHPRGAVVRASCTLKEVGAVLESFPGPALARAGSGVCYGYFDDADDAAAWLSVTTGQGWRAVIEFSPGEWKQDTDLWPAPGADLELMRRVKNLFDPGNLLNRGRLYGRI